MLELLGMFALSSRESWSPGHTRAGYMWGGTAVLQKCGLIYITKRPVTMLLLLWMHVHLFPLVHPAVLIFRADAQCGLKHIWSLVREKFLILAGQTCVL